MQLGRGGKGSRLVRVVLAVAAAYAATIWLWTRLTPPERIAAMSPEQRMRWLRWEDRLRLPAMLALVPPTLVAAFGVYLPLAAVLHQAWLNLKRVLSAEC